MSIGSAAILCRQCGAPIQEMDGGAVAQLSCAHCGARTAVDETVKDRLRRHLARVRRADQKARAILREQIFARILPGLTARARVVIYGSLGLLLGVVPIVMVAGVMLMMWAGEAGNTPLVAIAIVLLLLDLVLAVLVFPAALIWAFRMAKNADLEASRSAQAAQELAQTTSASRCSQCGGHAQVVVIGVDFASRCPWCDAPLAAAGADAARAAAETIIAAQGELADANLQRARLDAGLQARPKHRATIPGFELRGGIYEGWIDGAQLWAGFEMLGSGVLGRVELDRDTSLPGAIWFVRRQIADDHAEAAAHYRLDRPDAEVPADPELAPHFAVLADANVDARRVASHPAVRQVLASLATNECLHLDPAGASRWAVGRGAFGGTGAIPDSARSLAYVAAALA